MSDFQELIKNFERIRDYMRQFYIYGFKVRNEYIEKSPRTYDNEKRRIECFLGEYIQEEYSNKGKQVFISVDSKNISQNPLYAAWKAKSFTDNDIMLHFFLLELLQEKIPMTASELTDAIAAKYEVVFDTQIVRLKLKEYEEEAIIKSKKEGKNLYYEMQPIMQMERDTAYLSLINATKLFQEIAPFGFIGSTILDREEKNNDMIRFKHHYIVHTLEDGILYDILTAIRENREIEFENKSTRSGCRTKIRGIPLKIFVSTQTGRRYICLYREEHQRFFNMRLDSIANVVLLKEYPFYKEKKEKLMNNIEKCWGVSFRGEYRIEEIFLKLYIDEQKEEYVINRLYREGRSGEVQKISKNLFLYSGAFFDTNEILPWIKTFIGRIVDVQGTNQFIINKLYRDMDNMYYMYKKE